jgi:hypothetical protein
LTVIKRTNVTSVAFEVVYDIKTDRTGGYDDLFIQTNGGALLLPSIVPDKPRFAGFVRKIQDMRSESAGCSIKMEFAGKAQGSDIFTLLQAAYDAGSKKTISVTHSSDLHRPSNSGMNASSKAIEESRITFQLDEAVHAKVRSRLLGGAVVGVQG